jgi:outer membrane protein TolC
MPLGASVQGLLDHARQQSPELIAMRLEAAAAAQRIDPAAALPDPVLRVELMNLQRSDASPTQLWRREAETRYTLMQGLPGWGKRELRRDVAAAEAQQAQARAEASDSDLASRIKSSYAEYYRAAGNERLAAEVLGLMARLEQVAQARYAGGMAGQPDAIRAGLEQTSMRAELIALASEKQQQRLRLNALLALASSYPLAEPRELRPLPAVTGADAAALAARALAHNPQLRAEGARLTAARKTRDLTLRNRAPDLLLGLAPTQMGTRIVSWGVMFELNIPLQQGSRRAQEGEAQAMVDAAQARAEALGWQLQGDLAGQLAGLDAARQTENLVRTQLLPQSELGLQSALAAYENGKADFAVLLDAERQIRRARQELLKSQVEGQLRLAEIERLVGEDL